MSHSLTKELALAQAVAMQGTHDYRGPRLVSFVGEIGAGKSTAAKYLVDKVGFEYTRFAGPIKDMLKSLGCTHEQVDGAEKETPAEILGGKTPRYAMQTLGTEWARQCMGADFWMTIWKSRVQTRLDRGGFVVVDDCRFANEAQAVRDLGGVHIRIARSSVVERTAEHASEGYKVRQDAIVYNEGSISDLQNWIDELLAVLRQGPSPYSTH
jgi:hypothetical protein